LTDGWPKETILKLRQDALGRLLKPFESTIHTLSGADASVTSNAVDVCQCKVVGFSNRSDQCNLLMLGYFTRALCTASLYPVLRPKGFGYSITVSGVASELLNITLKVPVLDDRHRKCCPIQNAKEMINTITESVVFIPTEAQIKHLRGQALKSGLP